MFVPISQANMDNKNNGDSFSTMIYKFGNHHERVFKRDKRNEKCFLMK